MMEESSQLPRTAGKLARNPLGVIALFILLIYAIAALLLGVRGAEGTPEERLPLIWFLVPFPVLVLFVFAWLVSRHHAKLYAPADFRDDAVFLRILSPEQQREKLDVELQFLGEQEALKQQHPADRPDRYEPISRAEYLLVEDLALRAIEAELGVPLKRHVFVADPFVGRVEFDAVADTGDRVIFIEVKYLNHPKVRLDVISRFVERLNLLPKGRLGTRNAAILAFVTKVPLDADPAPRVKDMVAASSVPVEIRILDYRKLLDKFGARGALP
jgi:hypothetical protein